MKSRQAETFRLVSLESLLLPVPKANIRAAKAFGIRLDGQQLCILHSAAFACIVDLSSFRAYKCIRLVRHLPTLIRPV